MMTPCGKIGTAVPRQENNVVHDLKLERERARRYVKHKYGLAYTYYQRGFEPN